MTETTLDIPDNIEILAFSGSRHGMTTYQLSKVRDFLLNHMQIHTVVHGLCIGADIDFHELVRKYRPKVQIFGYPSTNLDTFASSFVTDCDLTMPYERPLVRNRLMIDVAQGLLATPKTDFELLRSGTWSAIRYNRKLKKPEYVVPTR